MNSEVMTDLLVRIGQNRDEQAFTELYSALAPRVKAFMMRQGADAGSAEELAQEAMMSVWRKAHLYSADKGSASAWVYTIARNLRIDKLRREVVWQVLPDGYEEMPSNESTPDENVSTAERSLRVQDALLTLPPEQAEVIRLSFLEGLSHSEIAERLDVPLGTVKSRMRLAYSKLTELVSELK